MSSLTRWDPFGEAVSLRDAVNKVMEQAIMRPGAGGWALGSGTYGEMNVFELKGKYYCQTLLPGALLDNIDLTVRQNTLTLKAKVPEPLSDEQRKSAVYLLQEFSGGEFSRTITF